VRSGGAPGDFPLPRDAGSIVRYGLNSGSAGCCAWRTRRKHEAEPGVSSDDWKWAGCGVRVSRENQCNVEGSLSQLWRQPPPKAGAEGISAGEGVSAVRLLSVGVRRLQIDLSDAEALPQKVEGEGSRRVGGRGLRAEEIARQEEQVGGPLRKPAHEVRIPRAAEGHVDAHAIAILDQRPL
jgi:hypothetical protein